MLPVPATTLVVLLVVFAATLEVVALFTKALLAAFNIPFRLLFAFNAKGKERQTVDVTRSCLSSHHLLPLLSSCSWNTFWINLL